MLVSIEAESTKIVAILERNDSCDVEAVIHNDCVCIPRTLSLFHFPFLR